MLQDDARTVDDEFDDRARPSTVEDCVELAQKLNVHYLADDMKQVVELLQGKATRLIVSEHVITESRIGKVVGKLRKATNTAVNTAAAELIESWRFQISLETAGPACVAEAAFVKTLAFLQSVASSADLAHHGIGGDAREQNKLSAACSNLKEGCRGYLERAEQSVVSNLTSPANHTSSTFPCIVAVLNRIATFQQLPDTELARIAVSTHNRLEEKLRHYILAIKESSLAAINTGSDAEGDVPLGHLLSTLEDTSLSKADVLSELNKVFSAAASDVRSELTAAIDVCTSDIRHRLTCPFAPIILSETVQRVQKRKFLSRNFDAAGETSLTADTLEQTFNEHVHSSLESLLDGIPEQGSFSYNEQLWVDAVSYVCTIREMDTFTPNLSLLERDIAGATNEKEGRNAETAANEKKTKVSPPVTTKKAPPPKAPPPYTIVDDHIDETSKNSQKKIRRKIRKKTRKKTRGPLVPPWKHRMQVMTPVIVQGRFLLATVAMPTAYLWKHTLT